MRPHTTGPSAGRNSSNPNLSFLSALCRKVLLGTNSSFGELSKLKKPLGISLPIVIQDEAGQACEPSALIPLTMGAEWVVMGADLKQLRPTLKSRLAKRLLGYSIPDGIRSGMAKQLHGHNEPDTPGGGGSLYGWCVSFEAHWCTTLTICCHALAGLCRLTDAVWLLSQLAGLCKQTDVVCLLS